MISIAAERCRNPASTVLTAFMLVTIVVCGVPRLASCRAGALVPRKGERWAADETAARFTNGIRYRRFGVARGFLALDAALGPRRPPIEDIVWPSAIAAVWQRLLVGTREIARDAVPCVIVSWAFLVRAETSPRCCFSLTRSGSSVTPDDHGDLVSLGDPDRPAVLEGRWPTVSRNAHKFFRADSPLIPSPTDQRGSDPKGGQDLSVTYTHTTIRANLYLIEGNDEAPNRESSTHFAASPAHRASSGDPRRDDCPGVGRDTGCGTGIVLAIHYLQPVG